MEMFAYPPEAIILLYVSVSNPHVFTLNLHNVICQLYLNKAGGGGLFPN